MPLSLHPTTAAEEKEVGRVVLLDLAGLEAV